MLLLSIPFFPVQTEILISPDICKLFFSPLLQIWSCCFSKEKQFQSQAEPLATMISDPASCQPRLG